MPSVPLLDGMDEILLADRFAAALAAAPAVSCAVPLPATMPACKLSKTGLPMPIPLASDGPLFGRPMRHSRSAPVLEPAGHSADGVPKGSKKHGASKAVEDMDIHELEAEDLAKMTSAVHELRSEYNALRQQAATREARLEALQMQAQLGASLWRLGPPQA